MTKNQKLALGCGGGGCLGLILLGVVCVVLVAIGAMSMPGSNSSSEDSSDSDTSDAREGGGAESGAEVTSETVLIRDPVENAFTIEMPKGWQNIAYTARAYDISHTVASSISPDSSTVLFFGDPSIPNFTTPDFEAVAISYEIAKVNPLVRIAEFQPAETFLPAYAERKFGKLDGFEVVSTERDPEGQRRLEGKVRQAGLPHTVTAALVRFRFKEKGATINVMLFGTTLFAIGGWTVNVTGISSSRDPQQYYEMLVRVGDSFKTDPEWRAKQDQLHEQRMAAIRQQGQQAMQDSATRHQERMNAIQAAGDANTKRYYERSAASDNQQRNFLNYINDENTVASPSGKTFQVDNSYQRYFMHKGNGTYVGGDSTTDLDSLRQQGLNPDDYEEVKIKRN